ncbi:MAG: nuclear transport factor 2 family protein [Planctomycetota bacterium]
MNINTTGMNYLKSSGNQTVTAEQNKQIVSQFFERFCAGDVGGALELLSDSVIWKAMGRDGGLPLSGERNKQTIGEMITDVEAAFVSGIMLTPTAWTCEGNRVAVEMESFAEKANGLVYNNFYHFLAIVEDGKIEFLKEYFDTLHVKQIFIDDR